jgi:hypothetical protein
VTGDTVKAVVIPVPTSTATWSDLIRQQARSSAPCRRP